MPEFACPLCQRAFSVPDGTTAARVRCPHCRQAVELPTTDPRWFYARDKKKYGPFSWQQLHTLAKMGTLKPDDMLLREGTRQWVRAATLGELFPPAKAPRPTAQPTRRRPIARIASVAAAVAVALVSLCAVGGYFVFRPNHPNDDPPPALDKVVEIKDKEPPKKLVEAPKSDNSVDKKDKKPPKSIQPTHERMADTLVGQLNRYRQSAGLGSVRLDDELSRGCQKVAKQAAPTEVVNLLVALVEPSAALDGWMGRIGSRAPLLNPEMRTIGLAFERNAKGEWISVLDPVRGRGEPIVVYPSPKQEEVPLAFSGGPELPDTKSAGGFPITVLFPPTKTITDPAIELRDDKGKAVDAVIWTPAKPVPKTRPRNAIALIPRSMLLSNRVYQVKASAQVDGKPWSLSWSFTTEDDSDSKGTWAKKALAKVNAYRARANLPAVALDDTLSRGCSGHARYLVINADHPAVQGLNAHDEDLSLPGATEEGRKAGKASNIAIGDYEPLDGIDAWMATLYHRVPIMEPALKRIGFGCARSARFGWITVLNVGSGRDGTERTAPILYPVPEQTNVPLNFPNGGEEPNPIPDSKTGRAGYPITAFFPRKNPLKDAVGTLTNAKGEPVACWMSSREKPANPKFPQHQDTTFCLIPKEPLEPNTTYHVEVRGQLAGVAWEKRWKFTTAEAGLSSAQGAKQSLDRLNQARMQAGLSGVVLDEEQSRGCQLHAEYLAMNAQILMKQKASVNDEDPLLPGYTADGLRAARQSDVFSNAPVPVTQIDDLMATFTRRVALLDPALQRVGIGCAHDVGRGWRCVLDLNGGKGDARVVVYPAPKQEDVPCTGADDGKDKFGFPITVIFPLQASPRNAQAVLTDATGNVEVLVAPKSPPGTIAIYPLAPLRPNQTYSVTVSAIVNATEWRRTWQFTTRK